MTETENVATYARIRPYNPAINEDKRLTARCSSGNKILNQHNVNTEDTYSFTKVFDMNDTTETVFNLAMKPLLDYKILQGINSIFIVYGQSGSGKSFTLIGEPNHLGLLPLSLQYLLKQDNVESIYISSIEAYGIKSTKIGFYDLVSQLKIKQSMFDQKSNSKKNKFDPYTSKDNNRLNSNNAQRIQITMNNCLQIITKLQQVSHMAPTLKNPHSSRGHTVYFACIKMNGLEDVYFIAVDLAGSEGQTALGTKDEFINGLKLAMAKGKLKLTKKQMRGFEQMYKTRSYEAGCINNGLTQLQSIFGELIKQKISKSQGLGLRKTLSSFISLNSAYAILFTLSASANNNKVTRATLNFAKQTQLVKVDTQKAKKKIDKDKIIKELNELIENLRAELSEKNKSISALQLQKTYNDINDIDDNKIMEIKDLQLKGHEAVFYRFDELTKQISDAEIEEAKWTASSMKLENNYANTMIQNMSDNELKKVFNKFDQDNSKTIDCNELRNALKLMGHEFNMNEIKKLINDVDINNDNQIDFKEFKVMVNQTWFIDAFQDKLIKSMQKMLDNMAIIDDENHIVINDEYKHEMYIDNSNNINQEYIKQIEELKNENIKLRNQINKLTQSDKKKDNSKYIYDKSKFSCFGFFDDQNGYTQISDNEEHSNVSNVSD